MSILASACAICTQCTRSAHTVRTQCKHLASAPRCDGKPAVNSKQVDLRRVPAKGMKGQTQQYVCQSAWESACKRPGAKCSRHTCKSAWKACLSGLCLATFDHALKGSGMAVGYALCTSKWEGGEGRLPAPESKRRVVRAVGGNQVVRKGVGHANTHTHTRIPS